MTSKSWDDSDIVTASAGLDEELQEIFADMEAVLGKPRSAAQQDEAGPGADDFDSPLPPEEVEPWLRKPAGRARDDEAGLDEEVILPDEFELPPPAGRRSPLAGDFEHSAAVIAPAADREDLDEEELYGPAADLAPAETTRAARPGHPDESELPEAEILPDDGPADEPDFAYAATVAQLSPEDFSRLVERAVIRGLSKALKKSGR